MVAEYDVSKVERKLHGPEIPVVMIHSQRLRGDSSNMRSRRLARNRGDQMGSARGNPGQEIPRA